MAEKGIKSIKSGDKIKVISCDCGYRALDRLNVMGIHDGDILEIVSIQPAGPITIKHKKTELSIGRGLFKKIIFEVV